MGFAICHGACANCGKLFSFNPHRVPSIRVNDVREPVCCVCIKEANAKRKELGLEPIVTLFDAYEPLPEEEL